MTTPHLQGRRIAEHTWVNHCCVCGIPMHVHTEALSIRMDIDCRDCREPLPFEAERAARLERNGQ